ncbi:hypothetical protein B0H14DRAFT_2646830 [Mycena olivaceomarginata]|nr:hypothetical protein B0H14DRAFT_2646830 [Mycena olivaceomarginata]
MSYHRKLQNIRDSWPQLVPQSLKNKLLDCFRQETTLEALSTFTLGAGYNPRVYYDFNGSPYFTLESAIATQLNICDHNKALIPPWKLYNAFQPGALIMAIVQRGMTDLFSTGHQTPGTPTPASKSAGLSSSQETLGSFDKLTRGATEKEKQRNCFQREG